MRQNHREVFVEAAQQCTCWIGLRESNPFAERSIGQVANILKGANRKGKLVDNAAFLSGECLPTSKAQHRELFAKVDPILNRDSESR